MNIDQALKILKALKKEHGGEADLVMDNRATYVVGAITAVRFIDSRNVKKLEAHEAVPKLWRAVDDAERKGRAVVYVH